MEENLPAWTIHESRLLQLRGVMDAAVVLHRKSITTKQMQWDRLAPGGWIWPNFDWWHSRRMVQK